MLLAGPDLRASSFLPWDTTILDLRQTPTFQMLADVGVSRFTSHHTQESPCDGVAEEFWLGCNLHDHAVATCAAKGRCPIKIAAGVEDQIAERKSSVQSVSEVV